MSLLRQAAEAALFIVDHRRYRTELGNGSNY